MQTVNFGDIGGSVVFLESLLLQTLSITTTLFVLLFKRWVCSLAVIVLRQGLAGWC